MKTRILDHISRASVAHRPCGQHTPGHRHRTHGYCTVGDVIGAAGATDAIHADVRRFIFSGFKHINAQINLYSRDIKLVPPVDDQDIVEALERLNIDFAAGRFLLSVGESEVGEKFIARLTETSRK